MAKETDLPAHIADYHRKRDQVKEFLSRTAQMHQKAYEETANEVLKKKDGAIDTSLLDNPSVLEDFSNKLVEKYTRKSQDELKTSFGKNKEEKTYLLKAASGILLDSLKERIAQHKGRYTLQAHLEGAKEYVKRVERRLAPHPYSHFSPEHTPGIVDYLKANKLVYSRRMNLNDAFELLSMYERRGGKLLALDVVEKPYATPFAIEQAKKEHADFVKAQKEQAKLQGAQNLDRENPQEYQKPLTPEQKKEQEEKIRSILEQLAGRNAQQAPADLNVRRAKKKPLPADIDEAIENAEETA